MYFNVLPLNPKVNWTVSTPWWARMSFCKHFNFMLKNKVFKTLFFFFLQKIAVMSNVNSGFLKSFSLCNDYVNCCVTWIYYKASINSIVKSWYGRRSKHSIIQSNARYFVSHTLPLTLCLFHFYRLLLYSFNTLYLRQEVIREKVKLKHRKKLQKLNK